jgi:transposase
MKTLVRPASCRKQATAITRIAVAFEAGRDGFWLARWLRKRGIEAHVIHAASVAVSSEHRRAKTDRLDTKGLKRVFLGWLRGEREHCKMCAIPTFAEEDAKRPLARGQGWRVSATRRARALRARARRTASGRPSLASSPTRIPSDVVIPTSSSVPRPIQGASGSNREAESTDTPKRGGLPCL